MTRKHHQKGHLNRLFVDTAHLCSHLNLKQGAIGVRSRGQQLDQHARPVAPDKNPNWSQLGHLKGTHTEGLSAFDQTQNQIWPEKLAYHVLGQMWSVQLGCGSALYLHFCHGRLDLPP